MDRNWLPFPRGSTASTGSPTNKVGELLFDAIINESPWGQVLIAAAFVENEIEKALRAIFTRNKVDKDFIRDRLLKGANPLLGRFWAGSAVLWAFGFIDKTEYNATSDVRDIRNAFAHSDSQIDFTHEKTVGEIRRLREWLATVENVMGGSPPWWKAALATGWEAVADPPSDKHVFLGSCMMLQLMYANIRWDHEAGQ
jgi:hypothetical protein